MKATKVAICEFLALHSSSVTDSNAMMREAHNIRAYQIASRRHLLAMRSELDATIRDLRRQVLLGNLPRSAYGRLGEDLKSKRLIDITQWKDADADRIARLLESGEIRTVADYRLATEYRDTIADPELLGRLEDLISSYGSSRGAPAGSAPGEQGRETKLSAEDLGFLDLLRRSAIASFEYAIQRRQQDNRDTSSLAHRADTWRTIKIETPRELRDLERAFWMVLTTLKRRWLSEEEFVGLTSSLKDQGLMDIARLNRVRAAPKKR